MLQLYYKSTAPIELNGNTYRPIHVQYRKLCSVAHKLKLESSTASMVLHSTWCTQHRTALLSHHNLGMGGQRYHSQPQRGASDNRWCQLLLLVLFQELCPGRCAWFSNGHDIQLPTTHCTPLSMYQGRCIFLGS